MFFYSPAAIAIVLHAQGKIGENHRTFGNSPGFCRREKWRFLALATGQCSCDCKPSAASTRTGQPRVSYLNNKSLKIKKPSDVEPQILLCIATIKIFRCAKPAWQNQVMRLVQSQVTLNPNVLRVRKSLADRRSRRRRTIYE